MKTNTGLRLLTALMMFPQIVETIYSPALTDIAGAFKVTAEQAGQTLSVYFFAFAAGVVFWGCMCDLVGRRPAVLSGLLIYGFASLAALFARHFEILLAARMAAAFGAAVGSVGTQTILRDAFTGKRLARVFAVMGIALAISPLIGMVTGAILNSYLGYQGVFAGLLLLAVVLLCWAATRLVETRPAGLSRPPLLATLRLMIRDRYIWWTAMLVALFNLNLFSYYQLAPFEFQRLGYCAAALGYSGAILAAGIGSGAWLNRYLLQRGLNTVQLVGLAGGISLAGGIGVTILLHFNSVLFVGAEMLVVMGFGLAIPNILTSALEDYTECKGTAGALLGLFYYVLLGCGLSLAGWAQSLGWVVTGSSALALLLMAKRGFRTKASRE